MEAATGIEESAFAGAEEEGKPGFSSGVPAPLDSVEDTEGSWDAEAPGGATSPVP